MKNILNSPSPVKVRPRDEWTAKQPSKPATYGKDGVRRKNNQVDWDYYDRIVKEKDVQLVHDVALSVTGVGEGNQSKQETTHRALNSDLSNK